jgi:hypothetical protein
MAGSAGWQHHKVRDHGSRHVPNNLGTDGWHHVRPALVSVPSSCSQPAKDLRRHQQAAVEGSARRLPAETARAHRFAHRDTTTKVHIITLEMDLSLDLWHLHERPKRCCQLFASAISLCITQSKSRKRQGTVKCLEYTTAR